MKSSDLKGVRIIEHGNRQFTAPQARAIGCTVHMKTINPLNKREHWANRAKRVKAEREQVRRSLIALAPFPLPCVVDLVRISPKRMDSHDGLQASLKGTCDAIADLLGVDDASDQIDWLPPDQEIGKDMAVRIAIRPRIGARP